MPLESALTISQLDESWPLGGDPTNKGDDHLRLIKSVLQLQFPGELGGGFAEPIAATEQELNWSVGLTGNIQGQLNALDGRIDGLEGQLSAPAGTSLPFYQGSPPTGWTQDTTNNDAMLRVVSTAGGSAGGTDSAILNDKVPVHTHETDIAPEHTHTYSKPAQALSVQSGVGAFVGSSPTPTGLGGAHSHTALAPAGAANWTPKYLDMIIASKDV